MRTTVEITDEQRAALVELAARRGLRGFSLLVQEALDAYLEARSEAEWRSKVESFRALAGSFDGAAGEALEEAASELRGRWR